MEKNNKKNIYRGGDDLNATCNWKDLYTVLFAVHEITISIRSQSDISLLFFQYFSFYLQHWECKFFFTMFYYFLGANYMWILVEGLYLHMLVSVAVFSENSGVKWLVLFGWGRYKSKYIE